MILEPVHEDVDPMKVLVAKIAGIEKIRSWGHKIGSNLIEGGSKEKAIGGGAPKVSSSLS